MTDYDSLISLLSKIDKDWEDVIPKEKEILVNLYIDTKNIITIPCEHKLNKDTIYDILKLNAETILLEDVDEALFGDLICAISNIQNLILQGIEDSVKSDLEEEDFKSSETSSKE